MWFLFRVLLASFCLFTIVQVFWRSLSHSAPPAAFARSTQPKLVWQNGVLKMSGISGDADFREGQSLELFQVVEKNKCSLGIYIYKSKQKDGGLAFLGERPKKSRLGEFAHSHSLPWNILVKEADNFEVVQGCSNWIFIGNSF